MELPVRRHRLFFNETWGTIPRRSSLLSARAPSRSRLLLLPLLGLLLGGCRKPEEITERSLSVKVAAAEPGDVAVRLDEVGTIEPLVKVDVKSTLSGRVVELLVREGEPVTRGVVLARVEPDVNQAQDLAGVRSAERRFDITEADARRRYENAKRLYDEGLGPRSDADDAEAVWRQAQEDARAAGERVGIAVEAGIPLRGRITPTQRFEVTAPMAGIVIARPVEIGETITSGVSSFNAGTVLYTIADLSTMLIKVDVNEVDIGRISTGQPVTIRLDAFPFQRFAGTVSFISPAARTIEKVKVFLVEIRPEEQRPEFRPGMTANVTIEGERRNGVLTVPTESVFTRDEAQVVFVLPADFASRIPEDEKKAARGRRIDVSPFWKDVFEMRTVRVGLASSDRVEILEGLKEGEKVALDDPARPPAEEED